MFMNVFAIVTGFVGLVSFLLQTSPKFSEYKQALQIILLLSIGIIIGSGVAYFQGVSVDFELSLGLFSSIYIFLMLGCLFVVVYCVVRSLFMNEVPDLDAFGAFLLAFIVLFLIYGFSLVVSDKNSEYKYFSELVEVAESLSKQGNRTESLKIFDELIALNKQNTDYVKDLTNRREKSASLPDRKRD